MIHATDLSRSLFIACIVRCAVSIAVSVLFRDFVFNPLWMACSSHESLFNPYELFCSCQETRASIIHPLLLARSSVFFFFHLFYLRSIFPFAFLQNSEQLLAQCVSDHMFTILFLLLDVCLSPFDTFLMLLLCFFILLPLHLRIIQVQYSVDSLCLLLALSTLLLRVYLFFPHCQLLFWLFHLRLIHDASFPLFSCSSNCLGKCSNLESILSLLIQLLATMLLPSAVPVLVHGNTPFTASKPSCLLLFCCFESCSWEYKLSDLFLSSSHHSFSFQARLSNAVLLVSLLLFGCPSSAAYFFCIFTATTQPLMIVAALLL